MRKNIAVVIFAATSLTAIAIQAEPVPNPIAETADQALIDFEKEITWPLGGGKISPAKSDLNDLSFTGTPQELFVSANADFEKGNFELANIKYSGLTDLGIISPDLFYNLGTSLYRSEKPGEAMLWFRRSLVAQPGMPEAEQNLEFLRARLGFLEFSDSKIDRGLRSLPPTFGKWLCWSAFWIGLISLAAGFCLPQLRSNRSGLITLSVVCLMLAVVGNRIDRYSKLHLALENFATITSDDVSALTSPTPDAESVIELPPGSEVRILQVAGKWIYVSIPGELRGWIRRDQLEQVWPITTTPS